MFLEIVVSALVGIILGGAGTTWFGIRPLNDAVAALRLHVERELGNLRIEITALEAAVSQHPAISYDRRQRPRGGA